MCPPLTQSQPCTGNSSSCGENCTYTAWVAVGSCSLPCGGGSINQTRSVANGMGCRDVNEATACNSDSCPVYCEVSNWTEQGHAMWNVEADRSSGCIWLLRHSPQRGSSALC